MDITYLLWLQELRQVSHDFLTPFMKALSSFSVSYLLVVPVLLYWCWDKRRGLFTLASLCLCVALTSFIKLTACVYRPWIRDPRIIPAGKLPHSYSFPSGHTTMGTAIYGGACITFWQKKQTKIIAVLCGLAALLNGFSRNYLGVHTPQDVLVGLLLSVACLYVVWKGGDYLLRHPEKENKVLLLISLACIAAFLFVLYKPYPMDYVDGKLLVNPHKMLRDGFDGAGMLLAFCGARFIEKTWIRFQATGLNLKGICFGLAGLVPLLLLFAKSRGWWSLWVGKDWGHFAWAAGLVFYVVALYPWVLKKCCPPRTGK